MFSPLKKNNVVITLSTKLYGPYDNLNAFDPALQLFRFRLIERNVEVLNVKA